MPPSIYFSCLATGGRDGEFRILIVEFFSIFPRSLSEAKSEHIDVAIRQELVSAECVPPPERPVGLAHLSSG
jgi:hypothetical protein